MLELLEERVKSMEPDTDDVAVHERNVTSASQLFKREAACILGLSRQSEDSMVRRRQRITHLLRS